MRETSPGEACETDGEVAVTIDESLAPLQPEMVIDGEELNALWEAWKDRIGEEFPGAMFRDAQHLTADGNRFVCIAALMSPVRVIAVWCAEAKPPSDGTAAREIAVTERTLEQPTAPEDLPEPLRTLASVGTPPPIKL